MRISTLISLCLSFSIVSACSGSKPGRSKGEIQGAQSAISKVPSETILSGDSDSSLQLLKDGGSMMRLIDARGLTLYYQNIFARKPFGFMHCEKDKPLVQEDCTDSIFTKSERVAMGSFDLGSPRMGRSPQNITPAVNLTLNYMRTLRSGLSRECTSLVNMELAKLKTGEASTNFLIKAEQPSTADLNDFFKRLLGLSGTTMAVPFNPDIYVKAFSEVLAANTDKTNGMRNAYIGTCIAISMDPLVFIY